MSTHVTHINLLRSTAPTHVVGRALAALLALTLGGIAYYGSGLQAQANEAVQRRDDVAQQLKSVQARMAALNGKQAQSAEVLALRKEIDALQPRAQTASALTHAVSTDTGGRADEFVLAHGYGRPRRRVRACAGHAGGGEHAGTLAHRGVRGRRRQACGSEG
jgi:hypothetical protein